MSDLRDGWGWIGVDFDGTLAHYESEQWPALGEPVPAMVERVRKWLSDGVEVRIVTARADRVEQCELIAEWCLRHLGRRLVVTNMKDYRMVELWDDRAIRVEKNTGRVL